MKGQRRTGRQSTVVNVDGARENWCGSLAHAVREAAGVDVRGRVRARPNGCRMTGCGGVDQRRSTLRPPSLSPLLLLLLCKEGGTKQNKDLTRPHLRGRARQDATACTSACSALESRCIITRALAILPYSTTGAPFTRPEHVTGIEPCQEARAAYARNDGSKTLLCPYPGSLLSVLLPLPCIPSHTLPVRRLHSQPCISTHSATSDPRTWILYLVARPGKEQRGLNQASRAGKPRSHPIHMELSTVP